MLRFIYNCQIQHVQQRYAHSINNNLKCVKIQNKISKKKQKEKQHIYGKYDEIIHTHVHKKFTDCYIVHRMLGAYQFH